MFDKFGMDDDSFFVVEVCEMFVHTLPLIHLGLYLGSSRQIHWKWLMLSALPWFWNYWGGRSWTPIAYHLHESKFKLGISVWFWQWEKRRGGRGGGDNGLNSYAESWELNWYEISYCLCIYFHVWSLCLLFFSNCAGLVLSVSQSVWNGKIVEISFRIYFFESKEKE